MIQFKDLISEKQEKNIEKENSLKDKFSKLEYAIIHDPKIIDMFDTFNYCRNADHLTYKDYMKDYSYEMENMKFLFNTDSNSNFVIEINVKIPNKMPAKTIKLFIYKNSIMYLINRGWGQKKAFIFEVIDFKNILIDNEIKFIKGFENVNDNAVINISENDLTIVLERLQTLANSYAIYVLDELKKMLSYK